MPFQLLARGAHAELVDLPWSRPLAAWEDDRIVRLPAGIHRHVVRFVDLGGDLFVIKELPRRYAEREYRFLRYLADRDVQAVEAVGVVLDRRAEDGEPLEAALITRHLPFSLPYRLLFHREDARRLREPMLDALVQLLVRLHLVGFLWGDCSLSNTLFRRDADRLAAYLVDTETGELHPALTDGQRRYDVDTAVERCAAEVMDLQAAGLIRPDVDPIELGDELVARYEKLWAELTRDETFGPDERYRIHERLRRINELGFDVGELRVVGTGDELRLELSTRVVEPGRYRRRLKDLTGLDAQESQARRLLQDISSFGAWLAATEGRELPERVVAARWLEHSFEPAVSAVPPDLRGKREPAQVFHEILDHWYFRSTIEGHDLGFEGAVRSYVDNVLWQVPDERTATDLALEE